MTVTVSLDRQEVLSPWFDRLAYYGIATLLPFIVLAVAATVVRRQQAVLEASEAMLRLNVVELEGTKLRLEEHAATLVALAEDNAAARSRAEAANMAKSLFLANMSHELRTPLNAVIGFSEMIERQDLGPLGNPTYVEYGRDIRDAGMHLLAMINDILDLSKIEADKYVVRLEPLSLSEVTGSCVRLLRGRIREAGIVLENQIADLPAIQADERAVRQVVINLLSNAIKFTPAGGRITLTATLSETDVRITVADTGNGIHPKDIPLLGRPFEQANNQLHDKPPGTGLGLALSRRLVELHGGELTIMSEVGIGTKVTIRLPTTVGATVSSLQVEFA